MEKENIFIWTTIIVTTIIILFSLIYVFVLNPGLIVTSGDLDVNPTSEPIKPLPLTYACQQNTDCETGLICDPYDFTCRSDLQKPCITAADCKFGTICSGVCILPDDQLDVNMTTFVDSRYVCNEFGLACDKGAKLGDPGNPDGDFCCVKCQPGDVGCIPDTTCGPISSQDGYTLECLNKTRNCPCQEGKLCVPKFNSDVPNQYECRVAPNNPCVCNSDCSTRSCVYYADGNSSKYPVGICRGPLDIGGYCTVDEGCLSGNCSIYSELGYGYCQPKGIQNGQTGAYCNIAFEPICENGTTCSNNNVCTAPSSYGLDYCDGNIICGNSFYCGSPVIYRELSGTTGQIAIKRCDPINTSGCLCFYGSDQPGDRNTIPQPNYLNNFITNCISGMSAISTMTIKYCAPNVLINPAGFKNSAPCISSGNCYESECSNSPALYRFLPLVSDPFPSIGLRGLNGIYFEKIQVDPLTSKVFGTSVDWLIQDCEGCLPVDRGYDYVFTLTSDGRLLYKKIINGDIVIVDNAVMDAGSAQNRNGLWNVIRTSRIDSTIIDACSYWSKGILRIFVLVFETTIYRILPLNLDGSITSTLEIKMPSIPSPGWTSISCSDYHTDPISSNSYNSSIILSNKTICSYCSNVGPNGTWRTINAPNTINKIGLGYGFYQLNETFLTYPVYGQVRSGAYNYLIQNNVANSTVYEFSKVRYPQNTYISNISSTLTGTFDPITPPNGSNVSDYDLVNVNTTSENTSNTFLHFAYIAKWGSDNTYYVYYVNRGLSMALPTYVDSSSKVAITVGNLYIFSPKGCE